MKIIKPTIELLPKIIDSWKQQYIYHHNLDNEYYVDIQSKKIEAFEDYIESAIDKSKPEILIAVEDNELLGFITFEISEAEYFDTNINSYGEVIELFVKESKRKSGVGKSLLISAEEYFKVNGVIWVELQVSTYNTNAIDMYKHMDYKNRQTLMFKKLV